MNRMNTIGVALSLALFGGSTSFADSKLMRAQADIKGCVDDSHISDHSRISGTAQLIEQSTKEGIKQVVVIMLVKGLSDGKHAVHIHETGECKPCSAANGHHDPGPNSNTDPDAPDYNHPFHMGDLINLEVHDGLGVMYTTTNRITLSAGRLSIFDRDGSAFIIHSKEDTYCDQKNELKSGCAGGPRDACGVIKLVSDK